MIQKTCIIVILCILFLTISCNKRETETISKPQPNIQTPKLEFVVSGCEDKNEEVYENIRGGIQQENVEINVEENYVKLKHHLKYVCCAKVVVKFEKIGNVIKLIEKNEGDMCRCICEYDVESKVGPLTNGRYTIELYGVEFEDMPGEKLFEKEIVVGEENIGIPNPASVFCEKNGGRVVIRKDTEGNEYGVCVFDDGKECDEWAFFRGECKKDGVKEGFCGTSTKGRCSSDDECIVSGCSSQVCQSKYEEAIITTCEYKECYDAVKYDMKCGCKKEGCIWS